MSPSIILSFPRIEVVSDFVQQELSIYNGFVFLLQLLLGLGIALLQTIRSGEWLDVSVEVWLEEEWYTWMAELA